MILGFRHKGLAQLYRGSIRKGLSAEQVPKLERILARLDVATRPEMMDLPGWKLHPLKGDLKGHWAVWVTGNWRVTFRFEGVNVEDVDLVDYH
ncbi:MAG: Killer protein [Candidatus Melainabacteria bacterium]|nr:MAG: Killer protein [Candidatus Melainabacteria bacterium]